MNIIILSIIILKGYTPNWSREIFVINKINDIHIHIIPYTYNLKDLNDEEIIGSFYDRELQKTKLYIEVLIILK